MNNPNINHTDLSLLAVNFREFKSRASQDNVKDQLIRELTTKNQYLNQFAYITSHNLRVPLKNLRGLLDLLNFDLFDEYNRAIIQLFGDSIQHLDETIEDLTQMLSTQNNPIQQAELVSIPDSFGKVCLDFTRQIHTLGIIIHTDFQCDTIHFTKSYMESVLNNLISNAIKYAHPERPLEVSVSSVRGPGREVIMTFSDNGVGIDMEKHRDNVFGLNQRFHSHVEGKGIGLYITKTQIESLKGTIEVESFVNQGTTFKITLPSVFNM
ncbi:sensor histidine kinase [Pedobacter antarcticus]|uniref:sensor histidine kinase n=1 Tax=Pedobacter antarcticus TaxID=34086 RepID=UPI001C59BC21|nr:HAMP domain-containing sensor histidine kinase [Pedobacter antarcticus]